MHTCIQSIEMFPRQKDEKRSLYLSIQKVEVGKSEDQGQAELHKFMSMKLPKYAES